MDWLEIILFIIALIIMVVGLLGVILPFVPGIPMIFGAALVYAILTDYSDINSRIIILLGAMTIVSLVLDWVATAFGVKKMGGSYAGIIGAFLGMIVGLMLPGIGIVGFIVGAFVGAFLFELLVNKEAKTALRAGLGSFIGFIAGGLIKFVIGAAMIGIFVWNVLLK